MPLSHFDGLLCEIDQKLACANPLEVPAILAKISNDLFGLLIWRKSQITRYKSIAKYLCDLPPLDIQAQYAGGKGEQLLPRACFFINYLEKLATIKFGTTKVHYLDYGCGWGRLTRFLPRLTSIEMIRGVDPKPEALAFLKGTILERNVGIIEPVPVRGSIKGKFEVVFLFSVMTHTPPFVNDRIIELIREILKPGGLVITTVRPKSFWDYHQKYNTPYNPEKLKAEHEETGFSFMPYPHNQNYGEASYSHDHIVNAFHGFSLIDVTFTLIDPFQIYYAFSMGN